MLFLFLTSKKNQKVKKDPLQFESLLQFRMIQIQIFRAPQNLHKFFFFFKFLRNSPFLQKKLKTKKINFRNTSSRKKCLKFSQVVPIRESGTKCRETRKNDKNAVWISLIPPSPPTTTPTLAIGAHTQYYTWRLRDTHDVDYRNRRFFYLCTMYNMSFSISTINRIKIIELEKNFQRAGKQIVRNNGFFTIYFDYFCLARRGD